jgi:hypothetical protein
MSRVLKVNGDYKIQVASTNVGDSPASIILDTTNHKVAPSALDYGQVIVKGNLNVLGALTYVSTTNTQITDNILQLNVGQTGNGIGASVNYRSGIEIARGNYSAAQLIFDEAVSHYDPAFAGTPQENAPGSFVVKTADGALSSIQLSSIGTQAGFDINFDLNNTGNVLSVARGIQAVSNIPYYARVTENDHIPNRQFVTNYIQSGGFEPGIADVDKMYSSDTSVRTYDSTINATRISTLTGASISAGNPGTLTFSAKTGDAIMVGMLLSGGSVTPDTYIVAGSDNTWTLNKPATGFPTQAIFTEPFSPADPSPVAQTSQIVFTVDGVIESQLSSNGFYINNIKIKNNTIKNFGIGTNLILTADNSTVEVNAVLTLDNQTLPTFTSVGTKLYSKTGGQGPGKTGLFFVNSGNYADELVAKNRAVLLSMIF